MLKERPGSSASKIDPAIDDHMGGEPPDNIGNDNVRDDDHPEGDRHQNDPTSHSRRGLKVGATIVGVMVVAGSIVGAIANAKSDGPSTGTSVGSEVLPGSSTDPVTVLSGKKIDEDLPYEIEDPENCAEAMDEYYKEHKSYLPNDATMSLEYTGMHNEYDPTFQATFHNEEGKIISVLSTVIPTLNTGTSPFCSTSTTTIDTANMPDDTGLGEVPTAINDTVNNANNTYDNPQGYVPIEESKEWITFFGNEKGEGGFYSDIKPKDCLDALNENQRKRLLDRGYANNFPFRLVEFQPTNGLESIAYKVIDENGTLIDENTVGVSDICANK
jgi:hypothetical protein